MESGRREEGRGRRVASEDAGKDEKLPLSSGGVGRRRHRRPHPWHCLLLFSFPSRASLSSFLRRKWPLDVTVIILRASLARKNEQESELERAKERRRSEAAAAATKMPVGGKGKSDVSGWAVQLQRSESERKRLDPFGERGLTLLRPQISS